jgi:hypothetical protein
LELIEQAELSAQPKVGTRWSALGCVFFKKKKPGKFMRPKVVILILAVGFGLLAIMVALKAVMAGHSGNAGGQTPPTEANVNSQPAATNDQVVQVNPDSSNTTASAEQMRAAAIEKELDAIRELQDQADGDNNPTIISALLEKVANPEAAVRGAALEALRLLNDTNAIPGLQRAEEAITDPRGKVAVLDVIDYLKLPNVTPDVPPAADNAENNSTPKPNKHNRGTANPNSKRGGRDNGRQAVQPQ